MIDIRISGEQSDLITTLEVLRAVEHLQETGEVLPVLKEKKLRILEASQPYKNRGESQIFRQYIKAVIGG